MAYWREIFRRAFAETMDFIGSLFVRIAPALLSPLFLWWEFGMGSINSLPGWIKVAVCLAEAYAMVFIVIYGWKVAIAVPTLLLERDKAIESRDDVIAQLKVSPKSLFRSRISELKVLGHDPMLSKVTVSALLEIRSLDAPPTTMHDFKLSLVGGNLIASERYTMKVQTGELAQRRFAFEVSGISAEDAVKVRGASEWKISFKDVHDKDYETPVFKYSL